MEEAANGRPRSRKRSSTDTKVQERDLEKGVDVVDLAKDYIETESEEEDIPEPTQKVCSLFSHLHRAQSNDIAEKAKDKIDSAKNKGKAQFEIQWQKVKFAEVVLTIS